MEERNGRRWRELGSGAWMGMLAEVEREEELDEKMVARWSGGGGSGGDGLRTAASR